MKVKFLIDKPEDGDKDKKIFAFFPEERYSHTEPNVFWSYAHIGQHSACHIDYANECEEAEPEQYKALLNELKYQGYENIQILNAQPA